MTEDEMRQAVQDGIRDGIEDFNKTREIKNFVKKMEIVDKWEREARSREEQFEAEYERLSHSGGESGGIAIGTIVKWVAIGTLFLLGMCMNC